MISIYLNNNKLKEYANINSLNQPINKLLGLNSLNINLKLCNNNTKLLFNNYKNNTINCNNYFKIDPADQRISNLFNVYKTNYKLKIIN